MSLAAAQLNNRGIDYAERLLKRLQKDKYFDKMLKLDENDKNLNLELCLRLSYEDLGADLQRRFRQTGIVAPDGTMDEALAMAVWGDTDDALTDLVRRGSQLVRMTVTAAPELVLVANVAQQLVSYAA